MPKNYMVGVDLGGTKIAVAVVDRKCKIIKRVTVPTPARKGPTAVIKTMVEAIKNVIEEAGVGRRKIVGIGIGSPGPLNPSTGVVRSAPNLYGWKNVPLKAAIEKELGIATFVENDCNAAALGEKLFGAGKGVNDFIYITVGTGIGGGLIINGELYHGESGAAGEVGHVVIDVNGPRCNCGNYGCLEAMASGPAIARMATEAIKKGRKTLISEAVGGDLKRITAEVVIDAASKGDELALEILDKAGTYLGIGMAGMINVINPEMVILGGGVMKAGDLLLKPIKRTVKKYAFPAHVEAVEIVPAALGDDAGVIGAAAVVLDRLNML